MVDYETQVEQWEDIFRAAVTPEQVRWLVQAARQRGVLVIAFHGLLRSTFPPREQG